MVKGSFLGFERLKKAIIKWGYICNSDCVYCHSSEYRGIEPSSLSELQHKIDRAKKLGVGLILFSGGEPLLIKDIERLFKYSFSKRMYSGLITNGKLLANTEILKRLYSCGLRYVYMSLISINPKRYKELTSSDGLREAVKAILNILGYSSIVFTINIPVIKQNIDEVVDTACKLAIMGVRIIKLSVIEPKGKALKNYNEIVPFLSESSSVIAEAIREVNKVNCNTLIFHDGLPACLSPNYEKYNRDMYSENILYMSESFEKRFFKVDYKNMEQVAGICDICIKRRICKGIYKGYIEAKDIPLIPFGRKSKRSITPNKGELLLKTDKNYEVNIGKLCNNSCLFCANGIVSREENRFVELSKIKEEIKKAYKDGFRALGLLGGEITIHPDVIEIIRYARKVGFKRIALCTNGRRLSDYEFARKLVDAGSTRFMISIHSYKKEIENYLNGRKNAFEEKIQGLKNLIQISRFKKIEHGISLNTCIHNLNYRELIEFVKFFNDMGVNDFRFNFVRPENRARYDKKIIPYITDMKPYIKSLIEFCNKRENISISIGDIPFCLLPEELHNNYELMKKYIGEFKDFDTFVTIFASRTDPDFVDRFSWRKRRSNVLKAKSPVCNDCVFDTICEGLFKNYIDIYGIEELKPIRTLSKSEVRCQFK